MWKQNLTASPKIIIKSEPASPSEIEPEIQSEDDNEMQTDENKEGNKQLSQWHTLERFTAASPVEITSITTQRVCFAKAPRANVSLRTVKTVMPRSRPQLSLSPLYWIRIKVEQRNASFLFWRPTVRTQILVRSSCLRWPRQSSYL